MADRSFKFSSSPKRRVKRIISRLKTEFEFNLSTRNEPFLTLVRTILSQNTNRQNTSKAYKNLTSRYTTPKEFANAEIKELEKLIKPAGLYKSKSKRLKEVAKIILEEYEGRLGEILKEEPSKARDKLLDMPGVGPKTADCVLLFAGGRDVLPVDTHVRRTAIRLGFADLNDSPEKAKENLEPLIEEGDRGKAHILLIELGRNYCKARNPICEKCPVEDLCAKKGVE